MEPRDSLIDLTDNEVFIEEVLENKPEVYSVGKCFDNAKAYEELCFNLPTVPDKTNPDELIEKRLNFEKKEYN